MLDIIIFGCFLAMFYCGWYARSKFSTFESFIDAGVATVKSWFK